MNNGVKVTIDVESTIVQRKLAEAQEMLAKAAEHNKALSAQIERQRQEINLLRGALGMEWCRVAWRPVADGMEMPVSGVPVLAVVQVGQKRLVVRATYIKAGQVEADLDYDEAYEYDEEADTYWLNPGWYEHNLVEEMHWQISDPVTHWAPLPGLPEEVGG